MRNSIQSCNLNFLFGSGLSMPFLKTLGEIEQRLVDLEGVAATKTAKTIALASIRKAYFDLCIAGNSKILAGDSSCEPVLQTYRQWLSALNQILINRKSTLLSKQINLFTTNVDIFTELALESTGLEFNDGFYGTISPIFNLSNFKKSVLKTSQQYGIAAELPIFNLHKLHGSVSWKVNDGTTIVLDRDLSITNTISDLKIDSNNMADVFLPGTKQLKPIADIFTSASAVRSAAQANKFNTAYEKLVVVNPTKDKFRLTTLNKTYYELLRMYSNELERENTILFVMGFSFADEHIADITLRAARSNPTLKILIYAYDNPSEQEIRKNLKISLADSKDLNIKFVPRTAIKDSAGSVIGEEPHNLNNICKGELSRIANEIDKPARAAHVSA